MHRQHQISALSSIYTAPITLFITIVLICVITILTLPPPPHLHPPFRLKWTSRAVTSTTSCCHRQQPTTSSSVCWRPGWSVTPSMFTGKAWTPCVLPSWLSTLTMKVCVGRGWGVEWGLEVEGWCEGLPGQSPPVCLLARPGLPVCSLPGSQL